MPSCLKNYRDLEKAKEYRRRTRERNYAMSKKNDTNNGSRYTEEEIEMIRKHDISDRELSAMIHRSVKSIQLKRARLRAANRENLEQARKLYAGEIELIMNEK